MEKGRILVGLFYKIPLSFHRYPVDCFKLRYLKDPCLRPKIKLDFSTMQSGFRLRKVLLTRLCVNWTNVSSEETNLLQPL